MTHLHLLPKRNYDLNRFRSYPCYLMNIERSEPPRWRCFTIFSPSLVVLIMKAVGEHQNSECYISEISDEELKKLFTNFKNK